MLGTTPTKIWPPHGSDAGNGTSAAYTWDNASRLSQLVESVTGTTYDLTLGFSYNPASQITQNTRSNDSYAWSEHYNVNRSYTPDGLNRYGSIAPTIAPAPCPGRARPSPEAAGRLSRRYAARH